MTIGMIDRRKKIAGKPTARKKAKRPVAARGKTTRREAGRRAMKEFVKNMKKTCFWKNCYYMRKSIFGLKWI